MMHKTPNFIQATPVDCGSTCLGIVLSFYGHTYTNAELRRRCAIGKDMANVAQIRRGAELLGHSCTIFKMGINSLVKEKAPLIIHWNMNHFVVLEKINHRYAWINDPACGYRKLLIEDFKRFYTGICLKIEPSSTNKNTIRNPFVELLSIVHFEHSLLVTGFSSGALIGFLLFFLELFFGGLVKIFFDYVVEYQMTNWSFFLIIGGLLVIIFRAWLRYFKNIKEDDYALKVSQKIKNVLLNRMLVKPVAFFESHLNGELNSRFKDLDDLANFVARASRSMGVSVALIIPLCAVLAFLSPPIALAQILPNILLLIWLYGTNAHTQELMFAERQESQRYHLLKNNRLKGFDRLFCTGMQNQLLVMSVPSLKKLQIARTKVKKGDMYPNIFKISTSVVSLPVVTFVGAFLLIRGDLSYGGFVLASMLAIIVGSEFDRFVKLYSQYRQLLPIARRLCETIEESISYSKKLVDPLEPTLSPSSFLTESQTNDFIALKSVKFFYGNSQQPLFNDLNLNIEKGSIVNIAGPSGAGKSTLLGILSGINQIQEGSVFYDGKPLSGYAPVGYVTADDVAVIGSLSEFVANGRIVEIDRLRDIIELTQLSERVGFFVDGDGDERLEDQGFSRGEVQKLMLAQALYFNSDILLFDEAFNHISRKQTATILGSLRKRGVTVVMSTHRPEVQSLCDRIFVVELNAN
ncbi:MAG: cysteine peptidase family C39 domain-containing protein [Porticoccus sp.]